MRIEWPKLLCDLGIGHRRRQTIPILMTEQTLSIFLWPNLNYGIDILTNEDTSLRKLGTSINTLVIGQKYKVMLLRRMQS